MDVNTIAHLATTLASTATNQAVTVAVAKKAQQVQASSAAAMVAALPPVTSANLPAHIGRHVDTTA
ncbi:MAG TPA: YjfB family protein [Noviherbaspirillum sp.]|nr:YjfB family protein [Noviherbaspirillum sp.]